MMFNYITDSDIKTNSSLLFDLNINRYIYFEFWKYIESIEVREEKFFGETLLKLIVNIQFYLKLVAYKLIR